MEHNDNASYQIDGTLQNHSLELNGNLTVVCPIDRGAYGSVGSMSVKVFVSDKHSSEDICCHAEHRNAVNIVILL